MNRVAVLSLALALSSCKPAEEPPRQASGGLDVGPSRPSLIARGGDVRVTERVTERVGEPSDAPPVIVEVGHAPGARTIVADASAPSDAAAADAPPVPDAAPADSKDARDAATFPVRPEDLPRELTAALTLDVPASVRDEARRLNKLGLEAHKKLALDVAEGHYREALAGFAAFPFARFNLACALALEKHDEEALFHLAVLKYLADTLRDGASRERLEAARVDADFELLRSDERFRALTGVTGVLVTWVADPTGEAGSDLARKEAQRLVKVLREGRWPARVATTPWQTPIAAATMRVRGADPIAETAAKAMAALLADKSPDASAASWPIEIGAPIPPEAPPIVVIVMLGEAEPAPEPTPAPTPTPTPAPAPTPTPVTSLADVLGKRLRAERVVPEGVERHQLELKSTGFFTWEITRASGVRLRRNGRWSGGDTRLTLDFKETSETPVADAAPQIKIDEGLHLELKVGLGALGLSLDGLDFH